MVQTSIIQLKQIKWRTTLILDQREHSLCFLLVLLLTINLLKLYNRSLNHLGQTSMSNLRQMIKRSSLICLLILIVSQNLWIQGWDSHKWTGKTSKMIIGGGQTIISEISEVQRLFMMILLMAMLSISHSKALMRTQSLLKNSKRTN
jgi:hypothetical protein